MNPSDIYQPPPPEISAEVRFQDRINETVKVHVSLLKAEIEADIKKSLNVLFSDEIDRITQKIKDNIRFGVRKELSFYHAVTNPEADIKKSLNVLFSDEIDRITQKIKDNIQFGVRKELSFYHAVTNPLLLQIEGVSEKTTEEKTKPTMKYRKLTEQEKELTQKNMERVLQRTTELQYLKEYTTLMLEKGLDVNYRKQKEKCENDLKGITQDLEENNTLIKTSKDQLTKGVPIKETEDKK